jgi:hypothetical protein
VTKKQILTALSILALIILAVVIASLLVYQERPTTPAGWIGFFVAVVLGVLGAIKLITDIYKNIKPDYSEKHERQVYRSCSPDEYRKVFGEPKGWSINWVDRGATSAAALKALPSGRILISGRIKAGKTREAIELIQ